MLHRFLIDTVGASCIATELLSKWYLFAAENQAKLVKKNYEKLPVETTTVTQSKQPEHD